MASGYLLMLTVIAVICMPNFQAEPLPLDCGKRNTAVLKITGGKDAEKGEFPWMVGIFGPKGKLSCGGSLISQEFVLTAAHCFSSYSGKTLSLVTINIGDHNIKTSKDTNHQVRKVKRAILHKNFTIKNFNDDIALLQLNQPVDFGLNVQPICLPFLLSENKIIEGSTAIVTGWGKLSGGSFGLSTDTLRKVEIPIWKYEECKKVYNIFSPGRLTLSNLCAGDGKKNKDACIGDSGGPLILNLNGKWTQIGIVSWGKGCGSFPGVYTNVKKYESWILNNLRLINN